MQTVALDEVDSEGMGSMDLDRRGLADPLEATNLAINYYALEPGQAFTGGLHAHLDQEEVFYVVEGTATFEVKAEATDESDLVEVGPDEAIRFAPGEFQQGRNESDERVVAIALGAPKDSTESRVPRPCGACGESDVLAVVFGDDGLALRCPECGEEYQPDM